MARFTVAEVAEKLGIEREVTRGLVKFMVEAKIVEFKGERAPENGRGKPQHVYEFSDGFDRALASMLKRANLT